MDSGNSCEVFLAKARCAESFRNNGNDKALVGPGGKFRNYAAVFGMEQLRTGNVGEKFAIANNRGRSFIA